MGLRETRTALVNRAVIKLEKCGMVGCIWKRAVGNGIFNPCQCQYRWATGLAYRALTEHETTYIVGFPSTRKFRGEQQATFFGLNQSPVKERRIQEAGVVWTRAEQLSIIDSHTRRGPGKGRATRGKSVHPSIFCETFGYCLEKIFSQRH